MKRYPKLTTTQQVLAADPVTPLIKIQTPDGRSFLSCSGFTEVHPIGNDNINEVTAVGIVFGTEVSVSDFFSRFTTEFSVESEGENDGLAITSDNAQYGFYSDNVNLIINPNEQLVDPANNLRYVLIVNADEYNDIFALTV